jgi:hypothetical protein
MFRCSLLHDIHPPRLFPPQDLYISRTPLPFYIYLEDGNRHVLRNFGTAATRYLAQPQESKFRSCFRTESSGRFMRIWELGHVLHNERRCSRQPSASQIGPCSIESDSYCATVVRTVLYDPLSACQISSLQSLFSTLTAPVNHNMWWHLTNAKLFPQMKQFSATIIIQIILILGDINASVVCCAHCSAQYGATQACPVTVDIWFIPWPWNNIFQRIVTFLGCVWR